MVGRRNQSDPNKVIRKRFEWRNEIDDIFRKIDIHAIYTNRRSLRDQQSQPGHHKSSVKSNI